MTWYTANLLFKSNRIPSKGANPFWEERFLLIEADSEEGARTEATQIGKAAEHQYKVSGAEKGEPPSELKWSFERIERVCEIEAQTLSNGTELFSRFLRDSEVRSILTPFAD